MLSSFSSKFNMAGYNPYFGIAVKKGNYEPFGNIGDEQII